MKMRRSPERRLNGLLIRWMVFYILGKKDFALNCYWFTE